MQNNQHEGDINRLTIPQVVLLTLLTTTIASVATAIVTVQLMSGIPGETIFQTIERVHEVVVEPATEPNTQTIVIKEGDLLARAIAQHQNHASELYLGDETGEVTSLGYAIKIDDNRAVSAAREIINGPVYFDRQAVVHNTSDHLILWSPQEPSTTFDRLETLVLSESNLQVGQTLVYLGGDGSIVRGFVSAVSPSLLEFSENLAGKDIGIMI